jgi:hypothetical protein
MMKEALNSSETSVLTRATWRNFPEDTSLHSHRSKNIKLQRAFLFADAVSGLLTFSLFLCLFSSTFIGLVQIREGRMQMYNAT